MLFLCIFLDSVSRYDNDTQHAFVGDYSGQITLLKLERQTYSTITTLKGHEGNAHTTGGLWHLNWGGWARYNEWNGIKYMLFRRLMPFAPFQTLL